MTFAMQKTRTECSHKDGIYCITLNGFGECWINKSKLGMCNSDTD